MQLLLLSFALSMDSAALNMANGAMYKSLGFGKILFIAFMLGFFQFLMPLLGYFLGISFAKFISSIDHFIAFFILCFLGFKMLKEACSSEAGDSLGWILRPFLLVHLPRASTHSLLVSHLALKRLVYLKVRSSSA